MAMIAMTTRSSINVNAGTARGFASNNAQQLTPRLPGVVFALFIGGISCDNNHATRDLQQQSKEKSMTNG
jgi:hypothetical protein